MISDALVNALALEKGRETRRGACCEDWYRQEGLRR